MKIFIIYNYEADETIFGPTNNNIGVGSVQHELMICGIYINSFNVDEGVLVKIKPPIN